MREGRGITLTPGGRRLAALATEILGLAEQARRSVPDAPGRAGRVRVAATGLVAEHIGPLIDAFAARDDSIELEIETIAGAEFADLLEHRRVDIAFGPAPGPERQSIASVPFLRCRLVIVAAPGHPLAGAGDSPPSLPAALAGRSAGARSDARGPGCSSRGTASPATSRLHQPGGRPGRRRRGEGIMLTLTHSVLDEVRRRGADPARCAWHADPRLWHAARSGSAARSRPRSRSSGSRPRRRRPRRSPRAAPAAFRARARPKVHVTLWRSVADEIDAAAAADA